jgi:hypothetical protein
MPVADRPDHAGKRRNGFAHDRRYGHFGMRRGRTDRQHTLFQFDAVQTRHNREIDEIGRARQPLLERRQQRMTAGQIRRILVAGVKRKRFIEAFGTMISGRIHHHGVYSTTSSAGFLSAATARIALTILW